MTLERVNERAAFICKKKNERALTYPYIHTHANTHTVYSAYAQYAYIYVREIVTHTYTHGTVESRWKRQLGDIYYISRDTYIHARAHPL